MPTDSTKVGVGVTGVISKGLTTAAAPTSGTGTATGFTDLGWAGEDGIELTLPDAGDATPIKGWQNGATIRIVRAASDENPTWQVTLLETKKDVVEEYFNVTITQSATEGTFEFKSTSLRPYRSWLFDVLDGSRYIRDYVPYGIVGSTGSQVIRNGEVIGYQMTIEGEMDPVKGYNFKRFDSLLKS